MGHHRRETLTDIMSREIRSALMARVRGKNTGPERALKRLLGKMGYSIRSNVRSLPGTPDIVFKTRRLAVFVDGDFWHGYRFPRWKPRIPKFWQDKIETNRKRDSRNFARLRRRGWIVLRIWEHAIKNDPGKTVRIIAEAFKEAPAGSPATGNTTRRSHSCRG